MSTVQNIIDRSMRLIGQIASGEAATAQESADALITLNAMLDSWRNERLMCYAIQDESVNLAATNATRTIGPTGNTVTTRPVRIEFAYVIYSGTSSNVNILSDEEWASMADKTSTSTFPTNLYYRPEMPDGKIYLYPVPSATSVLHVLTWTPVTAFATVGTTVTLPPGWEEALAANLAIALSPEYDKEVSPTVIGMARNAKANIKRVNNRPIRMHTELGVLLGGNYSNILTNS